MIIPTSLTLNIFIFQFLNIIVTSVQHRDSTVQEFSERFKYDVISSSLLSSSITTPSSHRRRPSSLPDDSPSDEPDLNSGIQPSSAPLRHPVSHRSPTWSLVLFSLCLISLFFDCFLLCVLIGTALYYIESYTVKPGQLPDFITPTLGALNDLIAAAHLWDSAVHEAINLLELEESTTSSLSPSSPLRVALRSSLQNTQAHSDNVRHVLVGLTSPPALAQLSEMYAPPSPIESRAPLHVRSGSVAVGSRRRTPSTPSSEKRATWNGSIPYSYAALANAGSPSRLSFTRWEKRRSDLSALLGGAIMSAPTTPGPGKSLEGVEEEGGNPVDGAGLSDHEGEADTGVPPEERGLFASAALELQRQRRNRGVEMLFPSARSPLPNCSLFSSQQTPLSTHIARLTNKSSPSGPSSPSSSYPAPRFTAIQVPRHPLSLFSLTLMLNGALAARRYAASHLLALRFEGGDNVEDSDQGNDSYWEDVRAVMGLLTSALANATAPLVEALDASERERLCTENPTPTTPHSRYSSESRSQVSPLYQPQGHRHMGSPVVTSFAPLPSHLSRFAAHVDALTTALNDAREHLGSCVASLRDGPAVTDSNAHANPQDAPALHAYERVRRELGLALRECERGREPLLEILRPPRAAFADDDEDEDEEGVPALGPDAESSDSDKENVAGARSPSPPPFFSIRRCRR
ncbi:hypothetical protein B0F90DRAFT_1150236 [Multifurca ochricompacta]|uniref:Myosin-binding domain-containing protein n=1 Tax=Multifurca ochricompacta TaxID=376703 RepID=A0AAD4M0W1_9AGAM|nr:hypothetical protein B0F90DRAFT_1150236 [Multifurca ochricompacta]